MTKKKTTKDAVEILHRRFVEGNPAMQQALYEVRAERRIAEVIAELRGKLGLSQKKFADLVGMTASVISELEEADFDGNAMSMLERIATAVESELELDIRFVAAKKNRPVSKNGAAKRKKERVVA
jgi:ribosome-binding protein aMBF1 (putative translation factor)